MPAAPRARRGCVGERSPCIVRLNGGIAIGPRTLKVVRFLGFVLGGAVIVIAALGSMMSPRYVVARSLRLPIPPEEVWDVVADPATFTTWRKDVAQVEVLAAMDNRPHFREIGRNGRATEFVFDEKTPGKRLVLHIVGDDIPAKLERTIEFTNAEGIAGTVIRITDRGEVPNVFLRLARIALHSPARPIEDLLDDLAEKYGVPSEH